MSDDRLFVSNNAIGRKWYFINLIILSALMYGADWVFKNYIFKNTAGEEYFFIANFLHGFVLVLLFITLFSLIDRRLYDVAGDRRNSTYSNISSIITLCIFVKIVTFISTNTAFKLPVPVEVLQQISMIFSVIFLLITIILGFINGQITNLSYEKYKEKIKYQ